MSGVVDFLSCPDQVYTRHSEYNSELGAFVEIECPCCGPDYYGNDLGRLAYNVFPDTQTLFLYIKKPVTQDCIVSGIEVSIVCVNAYYDDAPEFPCAVNFLVRLYNYDNTNVLGGSAAVVPSGPNATLILLDTPTLLSDLNYFAFYTYDYVGGKVTTLKLHTFSSEFWTNTTLTDEV